MVSIRHFPELSPDGDISKSRTLDVLARLAGVPAIEWAGGNPGPVGWAGRWVPHRPVLLPGGP
jgi:hypothetical protein